VKGVALVDATKSRDVVILLVPALNSGEYGSVDVVFNSVALGFEVISTRINV
jgi:hypothetical protein